MCERKRRAVMLEYRASDAKALGRYHVADSYSLAALAVLRGDDVGAVVWEQAAVGEEHLLLAKEEAEVVLDAVAA